MKMSFAPSTHTQMLSYLAVSGTLFPTGAVHRMKLRVETRFMTQNADTMSPPSKFHLSHPTATKKGYKGLLNISSLKENLNNEHLEDQLRQSVKKIKRILASKLRKHAHAEELIMIDVIQRLGLEFYFQDDIHAALERHYARHSYSSSEGVENLHDFALEFRLLRQHGYDVSEDTFSKLKDRDGKFKGEIKKDIKGLMSLFEASHLRIPGEHILDDAGEFSRTVLRSLETVEWSTGVGVIGNTLSYPCHKSLPRFTAENLLQNFETSLNYLHDPRGNSKWIRELQHLARTDSCMAQINHHNEITQVSRWWKQLGLNKDLKLARNQPEIWHMWSLACLPGPNMADRRLELTKAISFIYIIDDIFDVYGTLEGLTLFTEAVNRWEYDNYKGLPNYMRMCLEKLHEVTKEISQKTYDKHGWNPKEFLQNKWAELCNAYLQEAKWVADGYMPSTNEYLKNGRSSSGVSIVCAYLFMLLDEGGNNRRIDLLNTHPDIVSSAATILRLLNDRGTGKDHNPNGHHGSYTACYMNEHKGSSAESAWQHVHTMISNEWKSINETCISSPFSGDFNAAVLNLARMVPVMYCNDDSHHCPNLYSNDGSSDV